MEKTESDVNLEFFWSCCLVLLPLCLYIIYHNSELVFDVEGVAELRELRPTKLLKQLMGGIQIKVKNIAGIQTQVKNMEGRHTNH